MSLPPNTYRDNSGLSMHESLTQARRDMLLQAIKANGWSCTHECLHVFIREFNDDGLPLWLRFLVRAYQEIRAKEPESYFVVKQAARALAAGIEQFAKECGT